MVTKNKKKIVKAIEKKKENLKKVLEKNYPTNPKLDYIHEIKVDNATRFLDEINEALEGIKVLKKNTSCELLSLNEFEKKFADAGKTKEIAYLWFKGVFCKMAKVESYSFAEAKGISTILIYIAPLKELRRWENTVRQENIPEGSWWLV